MATLDYLQELYKFKTERDPKDKSIEYIDFEDGRKYKVQHPSFFELHDALAEEKADSALFKLGLECLHPMNEKSPRITLEWLEEHKTEGINLWSRLLRGLLSHPGT